jgi:hypothetical protein
MWFWFFIGYSAFVVVLVSYAAHIALSSPDEAKRRDGYRVLKLIWGTATGASGLVGIALRLHQLGAF